MLGTTLLNYRIKEKLGAGGQGTVYKAVDERLGRTVVIKVLSPELTAREVNLRRFEREARLASSLDHPNICTIYGLHEVGGVHFIAMQYIQGKNVRELVAGRPLSLASALSIGTQVSDALTAAHSQGIIHRDIKAGNVMVTDTGLAKVLDFGLAKLLDESTEAASRPESIHLTELGIPYGTATYAAPEQATGQKVDHRADIFSTGVLLYEMLAGTWPFRGKTSVEVRYAVLHDTPVPLAEARRDDSAPPSLQMILDRALAKDPKARYQRMEEMRDELRAVMRDIAGLGAPAEVSDVPGGPTLIRPRHERPEGGFGRTFRRWLRSLTGAEGQPTSLPPSARSTASGAPGSTSGSSHRRDIHDTPHATSTLDGQSSIAILPFRNLSNDPDASFYEFSLADAVITELARLKSLVVRPSSQIVKYQGRGADPLEAGRELRVHTVLDSSFLRAGDKLRVNVQLLDVTSGELLWSDRIDASAEDIIELQDTIAERIVAGLKLEHTSTDRAAPSAPATRNSAAYEEYLRGRDNFARFLFRTLAPEDCDRAIEHFQRAIALDQSFALAYSGLGACYANRVLKGLGNAEDYELAEEAFNQALELDPDVVEARMLMVFIYLSRGEKQKARAEVARLRQKAPNEAAVYFVKAAIHRLDGEYDRALRAYDRLARLDPAARVVTSYNRARIFLYQNRPDDALAELDLGARREPDHPLIKTFRAVAIQRKGDPETAATMLREVVDTHPQMDGIRPLLAIALIRSGRAEDARAELTERVRDAASADHDIAYWLGAAYALLGEPDEAFTWLERAVQLGNGNKPWFEADPKLDSLRDDPRFQELLRRIDLSSAQSEMERATELPHTSVSVTPTDRTETGEASEAAAAQRATASAAAYEEYLRGRDANGRFIYHTLAREDSDEAISHFRRAVELDPNFALAHCALGSTYANRVIKGLGDNRDYELAEESFTRALAIDPQLLEARLHMIFVHLARGERQKARGWVDVLAAEAPNNVGVQFVKATLHRLSGEYDEALTAYDRMLRLNPAERVVVSYNRARIFMYQGRYEDALAELDLGAQMSPDHPLIKTFRAVAVQRQGEPTAAVAILREVLARHPRMDAIRPILAICLARAGETDAARAELSERVRAAADADHDVAYWLASAHALLGEPDEAFTWLGRAIELGNENKPWFETDPNLDELRGDPRFAELMTRIDRAKQTAKAG
jgi:serine/threonine protein kinase/tetratricopeptide (TPR) repeat protein